MGFHPDKHLLALMTEDIQGGGKTGFTTGSTGPSFF